MVTGVFYQKRTKKTTRLNLPWHTTWYGRRDTPARDMTPPADTPSSLVQGARVLSEWYSIPRPSGSDTIQKREEKKQNNTSAQRTPMESKKVRRLLIY